MMRNRKSILYLAVLIPLALAAVVTVWLAAAAWLSEPALPPSAASQASTTPVLSLPVVLAGATETPIPPAIPSPTPTTTATPTPTPTATSTLEPPVRFAVIGDYGGNGSPEADVAALVKSWNPDFIITLGDNNYPRGSATTIDATIGQYYHEFIYPYTGHYGPRDETNRFFPSLGNHDWQTDSARPYLDYFTLPGNERYYDFTWGPLHFFVLDSDLAEPDGVSSSSVQGEWLKGKLAESTSPWNVVYFHHAPYSSGLHGPSDWMQWPFRQWGASVVLSGHDHTYERLEVGGLTYFVNGLGGGAIYHFSSLYPGSQVRYNADYGAMLVVADPQQMTFQFFSRMDKLVDTYTLQK
jgi:tartrate-resistant acid phosphatase type 5